jgi:hypothetical protein
MQGLSLPAPEQFSGRPEALLGEPPAAVEGFSAVPRGNNPLDRPGICRRVADMPEAASARPSSRLTLNSDGQRHPLENSLAVFTLITGLIVFAVGWVVSLHVLASLLGIVSMLVGLYAQMISATREERVIIVTGLVAAFVGTALGFAHGGFWS